LDGSIAFDKRNSLEGNNNSKTVIMKKQLQKMMKILRELRE